MVVVEHTERTSPQIFEAEAVHRLLLGLNAQVQDTWLVANDSLGLEDHVLENCNLSGACDAELHERVEVDLEEAHRLSPLSGWNALCET